MRFFGWWYELPWQLRIGVGALLIVISTLLLIFADRIWPWGWVIGAVLIFFGGKSESEKKGYRF